MKVRKIIPVFFAPIGLFYPLLVYFGAESLSFRFISLFLGLSLIFGFFLKAKSTHTQHIGLMIPMIIAVPLCIISAILNKPFLVYYFPFLFSISLFFFFGYTLVYPPSIIEIFARMVIPDRSPEEIQYCRRTTLMWVIFFLANGSVAFYTACCASLAMWSFYNGFLSYCVIAALFATEWCVRSWRFRRYAGLRTDVLFKRRFPPKESS